MNEALKPYMDKDLDMDVKTEGENLRVILTDRESHKQLNITLK
jgi:hypothetical protein